MSESSRKTEDDLRRRAARSLVGGVSSGWSYLLDGPAYIERAEGARLYTRSGETLIDYNVGWGSLLLGHDPPALRAALTRALEDGFLFHYDSEQHIALAEKICGLVPCAERVRLVNSGTEATMHALRLARAATGKTKVLKFEGHFHGLHDSLLFSTTSSDRLGEMGPTGEISSVAGSPGVPEALQALCVTIPFNDIPALEQALIRHGEELAAVILEPIFFNAGCVSPDPGFLETLRALCTRHGVILIFDEVLTGFRVALGGAQERYGVTPDLACLGKALGCGMPAAAIVGKAEVMDRLFPLGPVDVSGTYTGKLLTVVGTLAALGELSKPGFYERLHHLQRLLVEGLRGLFDAHGVPVWIEGYGGRVGVYFGLEERPRDLRAIMAGWNAKYCERFYRATAAKGLYAFLNPLPYGPEAITLCAAHTEQDVQDTLSRVEDVLHQLPYATPTP